MAFRLPPLNSLRLFESAARHSSFKLAAEEVGVTPSAVSHAIRTLEDWLGTRLFARTSGRLAITEAGNAYLRPVREALELLASATDRATGRRWRDRITVSAAPSFAARLLLPQLPSFCDVHPGVVVQIDTSHHLVAFPGDEMDVAIRLGRGDWPGLVAIELLGEELVPVCAPELRDRLEPALDLPDPPLIHVTSVTQDWAVWLAAAGRPAIDGRRGLRVDTIEMAFDAAARGLGIAIGRLPLVSPELESGRLVPLSGPNVRSATSYWLVGLAQTMNRPEIVAFRDWLLRGSESVSRSTGSLRAPSE